MADNEIGPIPGLFAPIAERMFRIAEMAGVTALLKLVVEPHHPTISFVIWGVGSFGIAMTVFEPLVDRNREHFEYEFKTPGWLLRPAFFSALARLVIVTVAMMIAGVAIGILCDLIANYMKSH